MSDGEEIHLVCLSKAPYRRSICIFFPNSMVFTVFSSMLYRMCIEQDEMGDVLMHVIPPLPWRSLGSGSSCSGESSVKHTHKALTTEIACQGKWKSYAFIFSLAKPKAKAGWMGQLRVGQALSGRLTPAGIQAHFPRWGHHMTGSKCPNTGTVGQFRFLADEESALSAETSVYTSLTRNQLPNFILQRSCRTLRTGRLSEASITKGSPQLWQTKPL